MDERIATEAQLLGRGSEELMAVRLRDTVARSVRACCAAEELVLYAREAIATAGERVRRCLATQEAIRSTYDRRARLRAELNGSYACGRPADETEESVRTGC